MKLIFAIVNDADAFNLTDELNEQGYQVTKLASTGGFLHSGNTTLICGVEDDKVEKVLNIIEDCSKSRRGFAPASTGFSMGDGYVQPPFEVKIGGATIFVLNVEQFRKV